LSEQLAGAGLKYSFFPETAGGHENALFLASREPLDAGEFMPERTGLCHILEAQTSGLTLLPVHFPQKSAQEAGWIDLYRQQHGEDAREFTWISPRSQRGFRYDHALAGSAVADRLTGFTYDHKVRESGLSDHSGLVLELD